MISVNKTKSPEDFIKKQIEEEGIKDLDDLKPIDHATLAKPHTPIYKMHRYFARRPYSVFNELVKHYSNPGSMVLDPFCGGGVTVVESLRLRRRIVGIDLNPMATFITKMEAIDVNLNELEGTFKKIEEHVGNEILELYKTECPKCKKETYAEWFEWSYSFECPNCKKLVKINEVEKKSSGEYKCGNCKKPFKVSSAKIKNELPFRKKIKCDCKYTGEIPVTELDLKKIIDIEKKFSSIAKSKKLWYPKDKIETLLANWKPEKNRLLKKGIDFYYKLFTKRNILSLAVLFNEINKIKNNDIQELLKLCFTSTVDYSTKISRVVQGQGREITVHAFWPPNQPCENNVWMSFMKRKNAIIKGKEYSKKQIDDYCKISSEFNKGKDFTTLIINQSSTNLSLPNESVDAIITDPPYGGNVNYLDLSTLWIVWLKDMFKIRDVIDSTQEAIVNKTQNKGIKEYRDLMYKIFKECHRVLKPGRWMVMTFHNRDFRVWNALHLAAHDAGFILDEKEGMIYQPPIQSYFTGGMIHGRAAGAMLGDFILSFQKSEKKPEIKMIEEVEIGNKVRKISGETIEYHGGAKLSTIYMRLIPFLLNNGLLHRFGESDITPFLKTDFVERNGKWYFKENIDEKGELKPIEYVAVEARIEYLIRSLLYEKKQATMDEILQAVFTNLINGNAAEYEEISRVLGRIAEKRDERTWQLKEIGSETQERISKFVRKEVKSMVAEEKPTTEESIHDLMIKQLTSLGKNQGYSSHIGQTEQRKYVEFRKMGIPMGNNIQYGLNKQAFDIIREIDLLWLKGDSIVAAFEIEKSTTIDSGINRFRNLFAATPNQNIPAYIVIPDNREKEAINKIGSLANRKDDLHKKIKYLLFSHIKNRKIIKIEKEAKEVV